MKTKNVPAKDTAFRQLHTLKRSSSNPGQQLITRRRAN